MIRAARRLPAVAALTAVYALALGSLKPLDLLTGAAVGALAVFVLRVAPDPPRAGELAGRVAGAPLFAAAVAADVLKGTGAVAALSLGLRAPPAGIVAIPFEERTRTGVAVAAWALTLSPGEVLVDIDWDRGQMLVHTIDASDPEAVRERHRRLYRRYQQRVFP